MERGVLIGTREEGTPEKEAGLWLAKATQIQSQGGKRWEKTLFSIYLKSASLCEPSNLKIITLCPRTLLDTHVSIAIAQRENWSSER